MTLTAITAPMTPGGKARLFDLVTVNLDLKKDRIANIRHLINLSTLLPMLSGLVPVPLNDFRVFDRSDFYLKYNYLA